jgi:hypothetical protein
MVGIFLLIETFGEFCIRPTSNYDKNSLCETPTDVIFVIDGETTDKLQRSGEIVAAISANLHNIRTEGGAVSIFFNSESQGNNPNVILPPGPGSWPLSTASFKSSNTGCSSCRINDFNTSKVLTPDIKGKNLLNINEFYQYIALPQPVTNTGKLFKYLNQTLFNYEWWTPQTYDSAIPAKSVVLIDLDSVIAAPDSGQDRDDYEHFKNKLKYSHRDVRYLSVAKNQDIFKDILRDQNDKATPGPVGSDVQFGLDLAQKICENPATFQYNECHDKNSKNVQYVGYVTPGYKQNWAMYPEFFLKSSQIEFIV